uniref:Uncharacterized protein n=1 Tax=Lepeophtheirus salmonis TaxID=72036 RepID=A0A0K2U7H6_LEPSM
MYPYKLKRQHHLASKVKAKRLERSNPILQKLRTGAAHNIVLSDEKNFIVEQDFNPQNDPILAKKDKLGDNGVNIVQKPKSVMVRVALTETGKSPLVFVPAGVKINTNEYINIILEKGLVPWAEQHFQKEP